nr:MAG TPA: hypothetical protein [Caudoviricetes sp.]
MHSCLLQRRRTNRTAKTAKRPDGKNGIRPLRTKDYHVR